MTFHLSRPRAAGAALISVVSLLLASGPSWSGGSAEMSLQDCQRILDQIAHLEDLRRNGGSVRQMESWKQRRAELQSEFSRGYCRRWRGQLKR